MRSLRGKEPATATGRASLRLGAIGTGRGHVLQRIHQYQPRHADPLGIMHTHHAHLNGRVCRNRHAEDRLFAIGLDQLGLRRKTCPEFQIARQPITVHANFHRLAGRPCGGLHGANDGNAIALMTLKRENNEIQP